MIAHQKKNSKWYFYTFQEKAGVACFIFAGGGLDWRAVIWQREACNIAKTVTDLIFQGDF